VQAVCGAVFTDVNQIAAGAGIDVQAQGVHFGQQDLVGTRAGVDEQPISDSYNVASRAGDFDDVVSIAHVDVEAFIHAAEREGPGLAVDRGGAVTRADDELVVRGLLDEDFVGFRIAVQIQVAS
jgi:hypothetical protein